MPTNKKPNRLINEKSPYLLQHAYNPVNWYPWGEEAFEKAKRENKPLFVSIGYSTCHWCHVMERESFEDEEVAKIINDRFIAIKVDREERPDIDSIYMRVCQLMTGQGGWPLNVFLTPDQKPFYAGTYFPKEDRYQRPGLLSVVTQLYDAYTKNLNKITNITSDILDALQTQAKGKGERLEVNVLHDTFQQLSRSFDSIYGGFGSAPKFPIPHMLTFLYRYHLLTGNDQALFFAKKTLDSMANGGIYDHIGGGFARYSTDQEWLVPHFEKMLYDNALLLHAYSEGYQLLKNDRYAQIVQEVAEFVKRELTNEEGGFYSAIDADSEGVEGKYYVWSKDEILDVLGDELGKLFCEVYNISEYGNFEGENIPNLIHTDWGRLERYGFTPEQVEEKLTLARETLFLKRSARIYPHLDDKILTSWNGLMISGLAKASQVFQKQEYVELAKRALTFVENKLIQDGRLMVRYREGEVRYPGYIDDYSFLLWAYIEMYEATFDLTYIKRAKEIADNMNTLFWDEKEGGFFFYGSDGENLLVRDKEVYDGALPSGNSVAAVQLLRLSSLLGDETYAEQVEKMLSTFHQVATYGSGHTQFLQSLLLMLLPRKEIIILGEREEVNHLLTPLQQLFSPQYTILFAESADQFRHIADFAAQYVKDSNKATVYICENFACQKPTTHLEEVLKHLLKE